MQLINVCQKRKLKLLFHSQTLRCMKITAFILLAFCIQVSASTFAQTVTLKEHKAPLEKVINEIKQQTGYSFFYNQDWLQQAKPVDIEVKNQPLDEALKACFANQPFNYAIVNKTIVLKPKEKPVARNVETPVTITGKVTDTVGTPLIGATVKDKNTGKSTITDSKGEFSMPTMVGNVIEITYLGFKYYRIAADFNMPFQNVVMHPEVSGLKEVVVSTGYQNLAAERVTGSFATVDNKLFNRETGSNVLDRLQGIVPGLLVNSNVKPGSSPVGNNGNGIDIAIRGTNTLYSNMQPLVVVDNFPYDGNITNINPNDVENITVLKDAAAASIWGSQSGNGVIVINTKKGHRNQPLSIDVDANFIIGNKPNLFYARNFLDSKDMIDVQTGLFNQGYYTADLTDPRHPVVPTVAQILYDQQTGSLSSADATSQLQQLAQNDVRKDLTKYFYQKSFSQQYQLSFRGGSDKSDFYYSAGYENDLSNQVGNDNRKINVIGRNNFYPIKNLSISSAVSLTQSNSTNNSPLGNINDGGLYGSSIFPYLKLADANGNALAIPRDYNYEWITTPSSQSGYLNWQFKPLDELSASDNTSKVTDILFNTGVNYKIIKGLDIDVKYQFERQLSESQNYNSLSSYFTRNLVNEFTDFTKSNPEQTEYPIPVGGIFNQNTSDLTSNRLRAGLNYSAEWSSKHQLAAILGADIGDANNNLKTPATSYGYDKSSGISLPVNFLDYYTTYPSLNSSTVPFGQGYVTYDNRFVNYFTNAAYTYMGRYTISGSARIDKSNIFGVKTNQKSVPLYSAGLAWEVSKEPFYKIDWLPYLKLRTTYGYNGNVNTSIPAVTTFSQIGGSFYNLPAGVIQNPGNPSLRWEKDRMINFGIDFASKNNVISGSVEYYLKNNTDLIGNDLLPFSVGVVGDAYEGNVASTSGHGLDIDLRFAVIRTNQFSWNINLLTSNVIDKVAKYNFPADNLFITAASGTTIEPEVGKPAFAIYSFKSAGLTHETGQPQGYIGGQLSTNYLQITQSQQNNPDSLKFWGSARPTVFGSFRNDFRYKNWSLSANVIYKLNYYFKKSLLSYKSLFTQGVGNVDYSKRWQKPGDELNTNVPAMPSYTNINSNEEYFYINSESAVDKGDHIRLQDVRISYDVNRPRLLNNSVKKLTLFIIANNLGILWRANKDNLDPDVYADGYPTPRTLSFGIKASL